MDLFKELNNLMVKYNFSPSRKKAQNFVVSLRLLEKMVKDADLKKTDVVLEIGGGTGFLTRELLKQCKVVVFELDSNLCELLKQEFAKEISEGNLDIVEGNFLDQILPQFTKVVALPPYTISTPLLFKLLEHDFGLAVLVFQREFVFKALSEPGYKEFCPLAVMLDYYFDSEILLDKIGPESFFPSPKAFSSLVLLSRKKHVKRLVKDQKFKLFLKSVFRYKNKHISNALQKAYPFIKTGLKIKNKKEFDKIVDNFAQKNLKVYLLETKEFVEIFEKLF